MRNLLLGVIVGLLAVVHSIPVTTVTQIPTKAEDEILLEAVTDGFLIKLPSLTTVSPKRNTTVPASQQSSSVSPERGDFEGSALGETSDLFHQHEGEHHATTTQSVSHAQSSTSTVFLRVIDHSSADSATTQSTTTSSTSSSVPNEAKPSTTPDHTSSQTTRIIVPTFDLLGDGSGSGEKMFDQYPATTSRMTTTTKTETSSASSTTMAALSKSRDTRMMAIPVGQGPVKDSRLSDVASEPQSTQSLNSIKDNKEVNGNEPQTGASKGHSTPGWIIIVAFIVAVAALIMLCVAIATRDKWNGPKQVSKLETKTNSTNQQREQEMETFLHNDQPKENGKAAEYTVIPLEELPEK